MTSVVTVRVTDHITAQGPVVTRGISRGEEWAIINIGGKLISGEIIRSVQA